MAGAPMLANPRALRPPPWRPTLFVAAWAVGATLLALLGAGLLPGGAPAATALAGGLLAITLGGALSPRSGFYARPINGVAATDDVCLTFDDGPDPGSTAALLALLAARGQRATFFIVGERARAHPALVQRIADAGHEVAVHSMRHAWHLCFWSPRRLAADLRATREAIGDAGAPVTPLFRPPNGVFSPRVPIGAALAGMELVGYTRRALDRAPGASVAASLARATRGLRPGAIVVLHDAAGSATLGLLPALLDELQRRGLRSVPLGEALAGD